MHRQSATRLLGAGEPTKQANAQQRPEPLPPLNGDFPTRSLSQPGGAAFEAFGFCPGSIDTLQTGLEPMCICLMIPFLRQIDGKRCV